MSDPNNALEWINYAEEDLIMARSALRRKQPLTTASCFHSQQCPEEAREALEIAMTIRQFARTLLGLKK